MARERRAWGHKFAETYDGDAVAGGYGPNDKPMTAKQLSHWWAVEAAKQKERAEAAEARVKELEAEIERRDAAENRMVDGLERLLNSDDPDDSPNWNPGADLQARGGKRINDPREQSRR